MTIFDKLFAGEKSYYDYPVSVQKNYLEALGEATDDFDRSYKQYKGQMFFMSKSKKCLLSILSFFVLIPLLPFYIIRGFFLRRKQELDAICRAAEGEQFVPDSLLKKYNVNNTLWDTKGAISYHDIPFVIIIFKKFCFHPYFLLKLLFKVAKYSALIFEYRVSAIIVNDEFSFTCTIMTLFCERHNVKHINVQHGEKTFFMRDSFFRFHECYIWHEHYKLLFISLKAEPSQFIIELPESMNFELKDHFSQQEYSDFKYYLGVYNEEEISSVVKSMESIKRQGKTVKYRPHPNYSDINLLKKYVSDDEIESPKVNILVSISSTNNVIGVHTTVLTQAYFNGQNVIIDDISFKNQYNKLSELNYILIDRVKDRLSMYQNC